MEIHRMFDPSITQALRNAREINKSRSDAMWRKVYGDQIILYERSFAPLLNGKSIPDLLSSKSEPVVLDIMAPSATIADLFEKLPSSNKFGIALSLEDRRSPEERARDTQLGIHQIAGDITASSTWRKIDRSLNEKKADLILERAMGGLACIPIHNKFYAYTVNKLWSILSEDNGTMLLQLPPTEILDSVGIFIPEWVSDLQRLGIEAEYSSINNLTFIEKNLLPPNPVKSFNGLRLVKRPGSVPALPEPQIPKYGNNLIYEGRKVA